MLRYLTAGESHGPGLVTIVEGLPAGLEVSMEKLSSELARRRLGFGRGKRMDIEVDELEVLGGIRHGHTIGAPVAVVIRNTEWEKWSEVMSPDPRDPAKKVTRPRPGHADLPGMLKYDSDDARDVLERASARETAARTVAGYLAKELLAQVGMSIVSHVVSIGKARYEGPSPGPGDLELVDSSPVRCLDEVTSAEMVTLIEEAYATKDTLGGWFEVVAYGVPPGLGSYVQADRRLDAAIASALMSIPAIKAVEIGNGIAVAEARGSEAHDEIVRGRTGIDRTSNRAGGVEGGMSNGQPVMAKAAMKPISTLMRPLQTIDMSSGEPAQAVRERSDVCAVPAAAVVGEQMLAWVLAVECIRKFGGDTGKDLVESFESYVARVDSRTRP